MDAISSLLDTTGARVMGDYTRMMFDGIEYKVRGRAYTPCKSWRYSRKLYDGNDLPSACRAFRAYEDMMQKRRQNEFTIMER